MDILKRNNVTVIGEGSTPLVFAHGYGCDQNMWRLITPDFLSDYKIVLYDLTGSGKSDLAAYDFKKYGTLKGHATDLIEICEALDLSGSIVVGHSVSAMSVALAAIRQPDLFSSLVMVAPSPCYINDGDYVGGFTPADIEGLLDFLDTNYLGWSREMAPAIMGVPDKPHLAEELTNSFCRTDPNIAQHFGRVTYMSDHRLDVKKVTQPTLILQCSEDIVAPVAVGQWLQDNMRASQLVVMNATGHCPHLSAPAETVSAIRRFLDVDANTERPEM
ncbi:sigma-B regulation protein RsbQ [Hoeflea halophila]|uniref:Sigma-B regulation protein RsbQ n=1 Tax=Hoeflea halophila TaxID=714899 RepID=A0A286IFU9_9HYPH|nr:alpha/beta hydrolase [Hoeflea halophila]SOE18907.1 sigma-B regulation protein RsbQ [Hoeflea halophila]